MLQAHFGIQVGGKVLNNEQREFLKRNDHTCIGEAHELRFYIGMKKVDHSLLNEIVRLFDGVGVFGKGASHKFKDQPWKPLLNDRPMVPGLDNTPTYNVESVELCLL